jgi:hypothetical protein
MSVLSFREVLPRTAAHKFGESPTAQRKFIATLDGATDTQSVITHIGILHTSTHPELSFLRCTNISFTETDEHHAEITYDYGLVKQEEQDPNPLARADVWQFSTGGSEVPALVFYEGAGNNNKKPLQNTAKDFIEGLTTQEAEVRASISGNRAVFPLDLATAVTNSVNAGSYLGGAEHTWFCQGISGQQASEMVNGVEVNYWQITVELVYRASGHNLLVPNVGWQYLFLLSKLRAWVWFDPGDGQPRVPVPSASPRALDANGGLKPEGDPPDILVRRVYPEADFTAYFGSPPFPSAPV